jgi:hypothetical protein
LITSQILNPPGTSMPKPQAVADTIRRYASANK